MKNNFSKVNTKFDELKFDINEVKIKSESSFNELKYEVNEKLSHSLTVSYTHLITCKT